MKKQALSQHSDNNINYGYYAWVVWGLAAAFFFCDYFARVSPSVMVPDLMRAFSVTALGLGNLSAFFYYPYVAMQLPVGLLVDRISVRWLLMAMALLTGFACYIFGAATVIQVAELGRFLLGFGAAFAFVGALKLASMWFSPSRLGLLAGLTQALGMLGANVGEWPVAHAVTSWGWRHTMFVMAAIFAVLAVLIALFVRDHPPGIDLSLHKQRSHKIWRSLKCVLSNPQSWWNGLYVGLVFAPTAAYAELWGVMHLEHVHHLSHNAAAAANGMIFLGWAIGGPIAGWISDKIRRRRPVMIYSAVLSCIFMSLVLFVPGLSKPTIFVLLFCYGLSNTGVGVSYALAAEINPRWVSGTSMAFANMASVIVGAFFQPIIGWLIDLHAKHKIVAGLPVYSPSDFNVAMFILPLSLVLAIVFAFTVRETYCEVMESEGVKSTNIK